MNTRPTLNGDFTLRAPTIADLDEITALFNDYWEPLLGVRKFGVQIRDDRDYVYDYLTQVAQAGVKVFIRLYPSPGNFADWQYAPGHDACSPYILVVELHLVPVFQFPVFFHWSSSGSLVMKSFHPGFGFSLVMVNHSRSCLQALIVLPNALCALINPVSKRA